MCGIAGMVALGSYRPVDPGLVERMCGVQECRGPDDMGIVHGDEVCLGHRRLSVIDLAGGAQPMTRPCLEAARPHQLGHDSVSLSYSGEVYNFRELRSELEGLGHAFSTSSDTEVVLEAYLEWGTEFASRLTGMFALAIWDGRSRSLLLLRDRFGVKPLHWAIVDGVLLFGSEVKALLCHPGLAPRVDADSIAALFSLFGVHRPGRTALVGVHEVAPGELLIVNDRGVERQVYWSLEARPHTDDPVASTQRVRRLLSQAVITQLDADVPLCALLSGGVDSSAVVALAAGELQTRGRRLATCTVGFVDDCQHFVADADRPGLDAPYVAQMLERVSTDHHDVTLPVPDLWRLQHRATQARDLPSMGDLDATLLALFASVARDFTVALSGESADELFGGYAWFHDKAAMNRRGFPWMRDDLGLGNVLSAKVQTLVEPEERVRAEYASALAQVPQIDEPADQRRYREATHLALTRFLPVLLDRKDRTSMAVGVEVRVPFCDHHLVEYVWNVPWSHRHPGGERKGLLRDAVADLLPWEVTHRPKAMFPAVADPGFDRHLHEAVGRLLLDSRLSPLLDPDRVAGLVAGHSARPRWQQRMALAYLVQIDWWMSRYDVSVEV